MKKIIIYSTLIILLAFSLKVEAQERIDRIINAATTNNETSPVIAVRPNGNVLVASETETSGGDINILVLEYNLTTSAIVRSMEYGETDFDERPVDIIVEGDGRVLILGSRRGDLHVSGSTERQHGIIFRIETDLLIPTTFNYVNGREFVPANPTPGLNIVDHQVHPVRMRLTTREINSISTPVIVIAGNLVGLQPTGAISGVTWETWMYELDRISFATNIEDHHFAKELPNTEWPTQAGNLLVLPNSDLLVSGYVRQGEHRPLITIYDNTMTTRVRSVLPIQDPNTNAVFENVNFYQSEMWGDELILVGDYIPGVTGDPHDIIIGRADIQANRSVGLSQVRGYRHPGSVGSPPDNNKLNDFHDFRVANIAVNGNELVILCIVRDVNETQGPAFAEFCIMNVDLVTLNVNYTYIFNRMETLQSNFAKRIVPHRDGYVFSGSREFGTSPSPINRDLIIGRFTQNTTLECAIEIEMGANNLNWGFEHIDDTSRSGFTEPELTLESDEPDLDDAIECGPPCAATVEYFGYPHNAVITENTVWGSQQQGAKYFINGTLTVQNVTLDITGCDVVFGECARIVFTGLNARLRANNSVFRPCDDAIKWKGLVFAGGTTHRIIDCVFKNAMTAIEVSNNATNIEQILNNTFLNNYVGVNLIGASLNGSISGNYFEVNTPSASANYLTPLCTPIPGATELRFYGIRAVNAVLWSPITNNHFVADDPLNSTFKAWRFDGINFTTSAGVIQKNEFVNNTCAIFQSGTSATQPNFINKIDDNEITFNRTVNNTITYPAQIAIIGRSSTNINSLVTNNKIVNNRRLSSSASQYNAIYIESCNNAVVQRNEIRGFDIAIRINYCYTPEISLNDIKGSYFAGIYVDNMSYGEMINCNTIDLQYSNSTTNSVGIFLSQCDQNNSSPATIHSNCIFNTETAIQVLGTPVGSLGTTYLPSVRNNFLYNYLTNGILIGNTVLGNIGTPSVPAMNTFAKNSAAPPALDINKLTPGTVVLAYSNFFMTTAANSNVTIFTPHRHSVASCGQQTSGPSSSTAGLTDASFKCDANGAHVLNPNAEDQGGNELVIQSGNDGSEFMNDRFFGFAGANAYGFDKKPAYLEALKSSYDKKTISPNTYFLCMSQYAQAGGDYVTALQFMDKVTTGDSIQDERKYIEIVRLKILGKLIDPNALQSVINELIQIITKENENYNQAYYALGLINGQSDFRIPAISEYTYIANSKTLSMTENTQLQVYPNPAKTGLNVELISSSKDLEESGVMICIMDITGKIVHSEEHNIAAGVVKMDVEGIPSGMYFIQVIFADQTTKTVKFIKE